VDTQTDAIVYSHDTRPPCVAAARRFNGKSGPGVV
jgi:hypothetical protein